MLLMVTRQAAAEVGGDPGDRTGDMSGHRCGGSPQVMPVRVIKSCWCPQGHDSSISLSLSSYLMEVWVRKGLAVK